VKVLIASIAHSTPCRCARFCSISGDLGLGADRF
jgi:hypothetical protein